MLVPYFGCGGDSSGAIGGVDVFPPLSEQHGLINSNFSNILAVSEGRAAAGSAGCTSMVGAGRV